MKLRDVLSEWLEYEVKDIKAERTYECYSDAIRRLINFSPKIVEMELHEIKEMYLQKEITQMKNKYAKSTINHTRVAIRSAYRFAERNIYINKQLILPLLHTPKLAREKKIRALTKFEQLRIEKAANEDVLGDVILFLLYSGLRIGELKNLKWSDYDEKRGCIHIIKSKTESGEREVPLCRNARGLIFLKNKGNKNEYIFLNTKGNPLTKSSVRRLIERIRKKTGVDILTSHVCRHSFATRFIEAGGSPKALAEILGHKDIAFTLKRYTTSNYDFLQEQISVMDNIF